MFYVNRIELIREIYFFLFFFFIRVLLSFSHITFRDLDKCGSLYHRWKYFILLLVKEIFIDKNLL